MVHAEPVDAEGALPVGAVAVDEAAAASDAGVVEQQVDVLGPMLGNDGIPERQHLGFLADIG